MNAALSGDTLQSQFEFGDPYIVVVLQWLWEDCDPRLQNHASFTAFGLDGVSFLHSSWYRAVFWICDQNSLDILVTAEQYLHSLSAFSVSHTAPTVSRR